MPHDPADQARKDHDRIVERRDLRGGRVLVGQDDQELCRGHEHAHADQAAPTRASSASLQLAIANGSVASDAMEK